MPVCPTMSQKIDNGIHFYERNTCIACGKCEEVCLGKAITLYGKERTVEDLLPELLADVLKIKQGLKL